MERTVGSHTRQVGGRRYVGRKKAGFWGIIIGLALLATLAWGIFEAFDDDRQDIGMSEGEIGWIEDEPAAIEKRQEQESSEYGELTR